MINKMFMRVLVVIVSLVLSCFPIKAYSQTSVFADPYFDQSVTQTEINNAGSVFGQQVVVFPSTQTFNFSGASNKTIQATQKIRVEPGFKAGPYTTSGKMKLEITKPPFDIVAINYPSLQNVLRYEKFELGIQLPTDIKNKVDNFVNNNAGSKLNPYLEWELKVQAIFIHANEPQPIVVDGFYTKEFTSWMVNQLPAPANGNEYQSAEYVALGGWNEDPNAYPFRVRFAPPRSGIWKSRIVITTASGQVVSPDFEFNVGESGSHGFMTVGVDKRFLRLDGNPFYPVGCNTAWPETNATFDPELSALIPGGEDFWTVKCRPRVYEKYRNVMSDLSDNGANYMRLIMCPTSTDIEYEALGNYTGRLEMADELDKVLELAETKDFFLHWNFNIHFVFEVNPPPNPDGTIQNWRPYHFNSTPVNGVPYCYNTANNGGATACDDPIEFFTDPVAKMYHKQRLRYILARWGYSTNVATFELMSEISQVGSFGPEEKKYLYGANYLVFRDWQVEMGNYIKSMYNGKKHLLTCSYAGAKDADAGNPNGAGMNDLDNTFNYSCFDIMTSNVYDFGGPDGAKFFYDHTSNTMLNGQTQYSYILNNTVNGIEVPNIKPLFFAEADVIQAKCDPARIELKRSLWQSMFSGLGGCLSWDSWYFPEVYNTFGEMHNFISQFDLGLEGFHPGASSLATFNDWEYFAAAADEMGFDTDDQADLAYLRSQDGNKAIGIITNRTINPYTIGNYCIPANWVNWHTPGTVSISNDNSDEHLKLVGMNFGQYEIRYFYTDDIVNDIHHSNAYGPIVPIEVDFVTTDPKKSFILFVANRVNGLRSDTTIVLKNEIIKPAVVIEQPVEIYPNPAESEIFIRLKMQGEVFAIVESMDGRICKKMNLTDRVNGVFIGDIEPSTYMVKCYVDGTLVGQQKIVKL